MQPSNRIMKNEILVEPNRKYQITYIPKKIKELTLEWNVISMCQILIEWLNQCKLLFNTYCKYNDFGICSRIDNILSDNINPSGLVEFCKLYNHYYPWDDPKQLYMYYSLLYRFY